MSRKLFTWKRIIAATACILALCLAGLIVFFKYKAGPEYARRRFEQAVSDFWVGRITIEDVRLDLSGRAHFDRVTFLDNHSRVWAHVSGISATLGNWPKHTVYLREVDVDKLAIKLHTYADRAELPLKARSRKPRKSRHDRVLRKVTVSGGSLEAIGPDSSRIYLGRLTVEADRVGDHFKIASSIDRSDKSRDIAIEGTYEMPTSRVDFSVTVDRMITTDDSALVVSLLGRSADVGIAGRLTGGVSVRGRLKDPANIAVRGEMRCNNAILALGDDMKVSDVRAVVAIDDQHLDIKEFFGNFCNGTIQSTVHIADYRSKAMGISGKLQADDIDLVELVGKGEKKGKMTEGKVAMEYSFTAESMDLSTLSGKGAVAAYEADILPMPLLTKISKTIGLEDKQMRASSDAVAEFTNDGLVIVVEQAYLTNRHAAIAIEPGGIIDVNDRTFDMYVNAVQLKAVGDFLRKVPVVKLIVGLGDKLTRLHVKGRWTDPASKLIRKEPIKDLKEGLAEFFLGAARSGGKLKDSIEHTGRDILNGSEKPD